MAPLMLEPTTVPIRCDATGVHRVGQTRVTLEVVLQAHLEGESPEAICRSFDTLDLGDVYAVIAYFLKHRDEMAAFLRNCDDEADAARRELEATNPDALAVRELILERHRSQSD